MEEETSIASIIIDSLNSIFQTLFSSIDFQISSLLDELVFLDSDVLYTSSFSYLFGHSASSGILLIANSLVFGFLLYYGVRLLLSHLLITQAERPTSFLFKLLFYGICMNSSLFLCEQLLFFTHTISSLTQDIGCHLFGCSISFASLLEKIKTILVIEETNFTVFSIDGILKSFLSLQWIQLGFTYAIRYILVKVFVLLSPFAFLSLCNQSTSSFFKAWIKCLLSLLFVQIFVTFILMICFSLEFEPHNQLSKFLICGAIFSLTKANSFVRQFLGGITSDITSGFQQLSSSLKVY